jgi:signal transduction histidine kinase/DNA-binding response OmpR family regulator
MYNKLLERQIRRNKIDRSLITGDLVKLFEAISMSYDHNEKDRKLIERSMELSSEELLGANSQLSRQAKSKEIVLNNLKHSVLALKRISDDSLTLDDIEDNDLNSIAMFLNIEIEKNKKYAKELEIAKETAESVGKAKAEFLATMSHEIRTPMNGVIGMTGLLEETTLTEEQKEYVETIRISGDSLLTIINDILDFSKIESGKMQLEKNHLSIRNCIEDVFDLVKEKANKKKLELLYFIEPDVPESVIGDITRLRQIIVNLVGNAIKFTAEGEIYVSVSVPVKLPDRFELLFSIKDTGIGIPQKSLDKLFKAFSQVDSSTTRKYGGTGLGLAICKKLTALMDGEIWAESTIGQGTTFKFSVTVSKSTVSHTFIKPDHVALSGKKVLIIDDNATNRRLLSLQCKQWGMEIITSDCGKDALQKLKADDSINLALVDMLMPEMDGIELAKKIREFRPEKTLLMLMISSAGKPMEEIPEGLFQTYLSKPVRQRELYKKVVEALGGKVQAAQVRSNTNKIDKELAEKYPLKILLAEDNVINQKLALRILSKMGYKADVVANGIEAVCAVERQQYDLVFMDVQMPEMDGLEATTQIRKKFHEKSPLIVAMTANAMEGDRERCIAVGMNDYTSKPIRFDKLHQTIEKWGKIRLEFSRI